MLIYKNNISIIIKNIKSIKHGAEVVEVWNEVKHVGCLGIKIKLHFLHNSLRANRNTSWMRAKNGVGLHDGAVSWAVSKKDTWKARASLFRPQKASATPNPSQTQSPAMKKMIVMATLQESQQNILMSCLLLFVDIQEVKTGSCIDVFYFKILQSIKKKENPFTVLPSIPVFHRNNALLLTKMS